MPVSSSDGPVWRRMDQISAEPGQPKLLISPGMRAGTGQMDTESKKCSREHEKLPCVVECAGGQFMERMRWEGHEFKANLGFFSNGAGNQL